MSARQIQLRGVEVHNLKKVDLDIPRRKLVVLCGVSGSGKTSLALDALYAEAQRRYLESFSAYTRQFLARVEKPAAERMDGLPPAIAVTRKSSLRSSRGTVGTATETIEYLRLLFAKIGRVFCLGCLREVRRDTPPSAARRLGELPDGTRLMLVFERRYEADESLADALGQLREDGFVRVIVGERTVDLASRVGDTPSAVASSVSPKLLVVVDRLTAGSSTPQRLRDSLEIAFSKGDGKCLALVDLRGDTDVQRIEPPSVADLQGVKPATANNEYIVDGRPWRRIGFSASLSCPDCGMDYPQPDPRLYSFNSPLGACPVCEGFGNIIDFDMDLIVPNGEQSIRGGAIAPWNTPAYQHELEELLALAGDYNIPVDVPFCQLDKAHLKIIQDGVAERNFGGLRGFFSWLERRKYKMHLRVFLSRWRSYRTCPACRGDRLREESLATRVGDRNIAEISQMKVDDALSFLERLDLSDWERQVGRPILDQVKSRLRYLQAVGLGYLALDRTLRTLSGGEAQRVALTSALGASLVNMLYVLDEPSVGLHPYDVDRLLATIEGLRDRGNTVVVVEHEESMLRAADQLIELGPGAGREGGQVVFQGTFDEMLQEAPSLTGQYLSGRRGGSKPPQRRTPQRGSIRLVGARGNNLKNLAVEFPLGVLCLVTGVSGSGKSTLVNETLYGALCQRKRKDAPKPLPFDEVYGDGQIDDVLLIDQSPIGRSPRSNPVTYVKAFDEIRKVFADTVEARTHNYSAGHFSFNVDGGRCTKCKGDGYLEIDMQFLADVYMKCDQCRGKRYRKEILEVTYRGQSIANVLEMTVREAFSFFRGQPKVQTKLKQLIDVGLEYLCLGQPANTLSAGEAQRLKLAAYLSIARRNRTLFLLDEPTTGLHFADIVRLLDCFEALLNVGHSLIVVEHNLQLMKAADWIIDLGPGAADEGGQIAAQGTPEQVAQCEESLTGRFLKEALANQWQEQSA